MRTLDWWIGDGEAPFLAVVLRCGRYRAILGSDACVALMHRVIERGLEGGAVGVEFPMMANRYEFDPADAPRMLTEIESLRGRLSYLSVGGAAILGTRREPIEFIPACGEPWLFYNEPRTMRVGADMESLCSWDQSDGKSVTERPKEVKRGEWAFDVWMDGPWGPDICMFGGVPGYGRKDGPTPCFVRHEMVSASSVFGGMLDLISIMARESERTGEPIEKEL
jgi:hypothetical protein